MAEIEERLDRLIRETWDTHLEILGLLMAENQVPREEHVSRLDTLVSCFAKREVESTLFEEGRRVPTLLDEETDPPVLKVNSELLGRVGDSEILFALARPIAIILGISPLSVSLALQTRDERSLRNLANKATRKLDETPVRSLEVPAYLNDKMAVFTTRLSTVAASLGGEPEGLEIELSDEFHDSVKNTTGWPEWIDIGDAFGGTVEALGSSLEGTGLEDEAESLVEQLWDGLGVGTQSFMRNAGRVLRGNNTERLVDILAAFSTAAAATDSSYSDRLASWSNLSDLNDAWINLNRVEEMVFGVSTVDPERTPVSVIAPATKSFGLDEPDSLPWNVPVCCWSAREQNALRDLFVGVTRTLPSAAEHEFFSYESIWKPEVPALQIDEESRRSLGIQVVAIGMELVTPEPDVWSQAWSSSMRTLLNQYDALPEAHQTEMNRMLRKAYDDFFPEAHTIWARRFYDWESKSNRDAYEQLMGEIQRVMNAPVMFDAFVRPTVGEMAPFPTLTFTVPVSDEKTPVWIPLSALASTVHGAPVRVRAVHVQGSCHWVCDRSLHLNKLESQPVDLIVRSVHGDALQFAIFG